MSCYFITISDVWKTKSVAAVSESVMMIKKITKEREREIWIRKTEVRVRMRVCVMC